MNDDAFSRLLQREIPAAELIGTPLPPGEEGWFPLTTAQRGMWFAQRLGPKHAVLNLAELIEIHGAVNVEAFYVALAHVTLEASTTRLQFTEIADEPMQSINPEVRGLIPFRDFSTEPDPRAAALAWMSVEYQLPHDPLHDCLWSSGLFKLADDHYLWYHRSHHIVGDGFSGGLVARRLAELYTAYEAGLTPEYVSFGSLEELVDEDHAYRLSDRFAAERNYWTTAFADKPAPVSLGHFRPSLQGGMLRRTAVLPADYIDELRTAARAAKGSFPQLMIAAVAIYFFRMTGAEDIVLGLPVTARTNGRMRRIPSMLANAVPLRLRMKPTDSVTDIVHQVARRVREALRNQRYRYEDLRRDLNLIGEGRHLFTSIVNIEPFDYDLRFGEAKTSVSNLSNGSIEDLAIFVYDRGVGKPVHIDMDASPEIYTGDELVAHVRRIERLLREIAGDLTQPIGRINLLDDAERARIFAAGAPAAPDPALRFMPEDFERQVRETPWAVAAGYEFSVITYRGLDERANRIANALMARGAGPEQIIGVCLPRGIDMLATLLGVLKSGAAYLPLDPDLPVARLQAMAEDAKPLLIVAATDTAEPLVEHPVFILDDAALDGLASNAPDVIRPRESPAYVIYTSGSTGKPKGVVLTRANLANFLGAMAEQISLDPADRMLAVSTISFDIAALELFLPLLAGARTIMAPRMLLRHPPSLARLIAASGATIMQATPSLWDSLTGGEADALRSLRILTGGEALLEGLASQLFTIGAEAINLYGPTETTIWSTLQKIDGAGAPPVGRPIARTQVYVLDSGLQPVPENVIGDLYIAGAGLARGYLNRPGLTAERFVANPFGPSGSRMYRTGDLAKFQNGALHFIGRADTQVKLRGYRIELGEIETLLAAEPGVAQAAVTARDGRLVGFVVPDSPHIMLDPVLLKRALALRLPEYMVPATYVVLPELPRSPAGKLDRNALPVPVSVSAASQFDRTPTQEVLVSLFCDLLGLPDLDIDANIFELGADSLVVAKIVARIRDTFGVDLPLTAMFETTTIAGLATLVGRSEFGRSPITRRLRPEKIPLGSSQLSMFEIWKTPGIGAAYNMNLGLRLHGPLNVAAFEDAANDVLERHESLRTLIDVSESEPAQVILDPEDTRLILAPVELSEEALSDTINATARLTFDVTKEIPVRMHLWKLAPEDHVLLILVHHIAADGASLGPLMRDIAMAYAARLAGDAPAWQPLTLQYADYALWQRDETAGHASQLEFWTQALEGMPQTVSLPVDHPYPPTIRFEGAVAPLSIDPELHAKLVKLARGAGASLFMVLQAGIAALLSREGAGEDIPIGSPVAARLDAALDPMIGSFFNHLVLRTDVSGNPSFTELVARVRQFNLAAYAHQDLPFERVATAMGAGADGPRQPLFQVMLNFQNLASIKLDMSDLSVTPEPVWLGAARYELTFMLSEMRDETGKPAGIAGWLEYRNDLFAPQTAARLVDQLVALLGSAVEDPAMRVGDLVLEA